MFLNDGVLAQQKPKLNLFHLNTKLISKPQLKFDFHVFLIREVFSLKEAIFFNKTLQPHLKKKVFDKKIYFYALKFFSSN